MEVINKLLPNEVQINGFLENPDIGPISMVNLLKYKDKAEYKTVVILILVVKKRMLYMLWKL